MQYFIGPKEFTTEPVFDPSLFVEIRKRIGKESFDILNEQLIKIVSWEKDKKRREKREKRKEKKEEQPEKLPYRLSLLRQRPWQHLRWILL